MDTAVAFGDEFVSKGQAESKRARKGEERSWRSSDQILLNGTSVKEVCHPKV